MAKKGFSSSLFWAKHIGLALALVIIAGVVITLQRDMASEPVPEGETRSKSVASGLSDFYREFRMSSTDPIMEEIGDFVLSIGDAEESLDERLAGMSSQNRPVNRGWTGEHKFRTFSAGNTLRDAISSYAQQEGMQVIWDLDQDFVIKDQFQMDNTVAGSLAKIASAIDSNFAGDVKAYLCPQQRSLVVTASETPFIKANCSQVQAG